MTGYELTHSASSTNYFYKVEVLGKVQVGNTTLTPFATNSAGAWAYTPLYTLDFNQPSPLQSIYMDQLVLSRNAHAADLCGRHRDRPGGCQLWP